jgi:hypothetical protein
MQNDPTVKIFEQVQKDFIAFLGQLAQFYATLGDREEQKKYLKLQKAFLSGQVRL